MRRGIRPARVALDDEPVVCVRRRHRLLDGEQETTSERSSGTVPITPQLARELKAHRLWNGQAAAGELVHRPSGNRLDEANYRRRVLDSACARAGLEPIGFHVLRHTHGSIVASATRDVQRRLRHASVAFTLETYIHLLDDGWVSTLSRTPSARAPIGRASEREPVRLTRREPRRGHSAFP
jgi:integrase